MVPEDTVHGVLAPVEGEVHSNSPGVDDMDNTWPSVPRVVGKLYVLSVCPTTLFKINALTL